MKWALPKSGGMARESHPYRSYFGSMLFIGASLILTAILIVLIWGTLNSVQVFLPRADFVVTRDLQLMIRDVERAKDAAQSLAIAPDNREMLARLEEANDLLYIRFIRGDHREVYEQSRTISKMADKLRAAIPVIDDMVGKGVPVDELAIGNLSKTFADAAVVFNRDYYLFGQSTSAFLEKQNAKIRELAGYIPFALAFLFVFSVASAFLFHLRRKALGRLSHIAWHDSLTEITNRAGFVEHCQSLVRGATGTSKTFALILIDLDRFKDVNDAYGHQIGDRLLQEIARYFERNTRASDFVARLGGDEFVMIIEDAASIDDIANHINRLSRTLQGYIKIERFNVPTSCSMGISFFPKDANNFNGLMRNADLALYEAKERGGDSVAVYAPELLDRHSSRIDLQQRLREALARDEFLIAWQPQFDLRTGRIESAEALLRWRCPREHRLISPGEFIPTAEQSGLIKKIDMTILEKACWQGKAWEDGPLGPIRVAVNLSGHHFKSTSVVPRILRILARTGLSPHLLEIELTENVFIENHEVATEIIKALRAKGIHVALDDFGTGYSNLTILDDLPLTSLKIDRSFVSELEDNPRKQTFINMIIGLGRALGLSVIAEGIETWKQFEFFVGSDCDQIQGYLVSKPIETEDFEAWMTASDNLFTDFKVAALDAILKEAEHYRVASEQKKAGRLFG